MGWLEKYGKYLALLFLALIWQEAVSRYIHGSLHGVRLPLVAGGVVVYSLVYGWYCVYGYRVRDARVPIAVAAILTLLALALNHSTGAPANNYFLLALLVVGFGLEPRFALIAIAIIGALSLLDEMVLLELVGMKAAPGDVALQLLLLVPDVVVIGTGAMALRYIVKTVSELREARLEIAQHAADEERTRIARDLHDLLGHSLSVITLKGELAARLLPPGVPGSDEVREMLGLSREALQQVRQVVSGYRQPTLANELKAARVALQAASIEVVVKQNVGALDRDSEAVLGWVIREAITNVVRHSGAKHCCITLAQDEGTVLIDVVNDGWRVAQAAAGNGLRGLEERLRMIDGELEAAALPDAGYRLHARLPAHRDQRTTGSDIEVAK